MAVSTPVLAVAVVVPVLLVGVLVAVVACVMLRKRKKMALKQNMHRPNFYPSDGTASYDSRR